MCISIISLVCLVTCPPGRPEFQWTLPRRAVWPVTKFTDLYYSSASIGSSILYYSILRYYIILLLYIVHAGRAYALWILNAVSSAAAVVTRFVLTLTNCWPCWRIMTCVLKHFNTLPRIPRPCAPGSQHLADRLRHKRPPVSSSAPLCYIPTYYLYNTYSWWTDRLQSNV